MNLDWCPGIREACLHWRQAPTLQQTFLELERSLAEENDAVIDSAKAIVEVVCQIIVDELDSPQNPVKPSEKLPSFGAWVSAAVRVLSLGDVRDTGFQKLISQHNKLTTALGELRNDAGTASHGRDGFLERLSAHHRRAAVLSADAIVTFLHHAYLEADIDLARTREPYERFEHLHQLIDSQCEFGEVQIDEDGELNIEILLPSGDPQLLSCGVGRLLYQLDRDAYVEALNAARSVPMQQAPESGEVT